MIRERAIALFLCTMNYKIVVDAMGGDLAPEEIVKGTLDAVEKDSSLQVILVGDVDKMDMASIEASVGKERITVVDAKEIITNDDVPTTAIKRKKDSSLVKAFDLVAADEEVGGLVSAGSTGAVLVGAFMKVGRIKGISRPALAPMLPTVKGDKRLSSVTVAQTLIAKQSISTTSALWATPLQRVCLALKNRSLAFFQTEQKTTRAMN